MKLTKKQRQEIYLRIAEKIDRAKNIKYICYELYIECFRTSEKYDELNEKLFPEFFKFKPQVNDLCGNGAWWEGLGDGTTLQFNKRRVLALLFCYEMCK